MTKKRADVLLVDQGLAESRSMAQRLVMAGQVRVGGELLAKASTMLAADAELEVVALPKYVSRGGLKLEAAIEQFQLDPEGMICADVGSSTGGFTDCLLQNGAQKVYAIDVGSKQLHYKLRNDPRVVVMEQTNARNLKSLPEEIALATVDASFISLRLLLPNIAVWLRDGGQIIALIKPQFEAGKEEAKQGKGVIRDERIHHRVLLDLISFSEELDLLAQALIPSPIRGPKGNIEFLVHLVKQGKFKKDGKTLVSNCLSAVQKDAQ